LDNRGDAKLFVNRTAELAALYAALARSWNILVVGDPGSGKTSLVRYALFLARTSNASPVVIPAEAVTYVHAAQISQPRDLLAQIVDTISRATSISGTSVRGSELVDEYAMLAALRQQVDAQKRALSRRSKNTSDNSVAMPLIVVDDVAASAGHGLFGALRDQLWETGCSWLVTTRETDRGELLNPPADAFFDSVISMTAFAPEDAREMIKRRQVSSPGAWPDNLVQAIGGNPRRILEAARDVVANKGDFGDILNAIRNRDQVIQAMGRPQWMLAVELDRLGSASASDDALLSRLGWTRPRAAQVFAELEAAGLVKSEQVKHGQGRPRKVYRLTPALDYLSRRAVGETS
jgi:hypothetical protein